LDAQLKRPVEKRFENVRENRRDKHVRSMRVQYPARYGIGARDIRCSSPAAFKFDGFFA
jgi:hypothetical protein